ncbi:hypothetical protein Aab01nite_53740 [Paractinoplanes abujensis]|uniref:Undecaprenyl-diphosphatase n=1 Tax=Paractinoplanes abujensis TaxID=882441 RepID=A0A7W7CRU6_9ACTN|nr:phosphatase PAP2 family protein [Actinoplanes abujensis]MBB4693556.1 undecaprenyl-diphosphatase [Actinoplanes abujensis]GID21784.1 hypothetical protein Aab01nite_53740 [Actinoplanes abujensis]
MAATICPAIEERHVAEQRRYGTPSEVQHPERKTVALVGGALGLLLLLAVVRMAWTPLHRADQRVTDSLNAMVAGNDVAVKVLRGLTDFGGHTLLLRVLLLVPLYLLIRRQYHLAAYAVVTVLGALIPGPSWEFLVGSLGPALDAPVAVASGTSFPSGHALGSLVAYGVLLLVFLPAMGRRKTLAMAATALVVAVVGVTRVALGVHSLSAVVAGWLLGIAWLAITAAAFRRRRGDRLPAWQPISSGLAPEAGDALRAAPHEPEVLAHPWRTAGELTVAWMLVFGMLFGAGSLLTGPLAGSRLVTTDEAIVKWIAGSRDPALGPLAALGSKVGNTHWIMAAVLTAMVLIVALPRRWRPVVFLAVVMLGEVTLFLAASTVVGRDRPDVPHLGPEIPPTASFPSGHVAAPLCLYGALALLVWHWSRGWLRWVAVGAGVLVPAYVGFSRLYWGVHHPLDLGGSLLLAICWVTACWWAIRPAASPGSGGQDDAARRATTALPSSS